MLQASSLKVTSEFLKTENKAKLWSMLQQNGAFNGISNNFFSKVREDFEIAAVRIEEENFSKKKMEKNKIFLDYMVGRMAEYKKQSYTQPYTADDIRKTRQEAFDNALNQKKSEFNQYTAKPKPPDVSFTDEEGNGNENVNDLLEKAIRDRNDLSIPGPISTSGTSDTSNLSEVGNLEVKVPENIKPMDTITVDSKILNQILEKLNTIEELLRKNNNIL